jgi:hypothetical protein
MAIILLEKYHAYAPPFKYIPHNGTAIDARIGGIEERITWDDDLGQKLLDDWDNHQRGCLKQWKIPSAHTVGTFYTVRQYPDGFVCTCPARGNCWHIKVCKKEVEDADTVENRI